MFMAYSQRNFQLSKNLIFSWLISLDRYQTLILVNLFQSIFSEDFNLEFLATVKMQNCCQANS